jgi:5'-nucleotidase
MKLLVVNDDGIDAPGIAALEVAARQFGEPIVVAPEDHHSGCGHKATTDRPLLVRTLAADRHAVDGTPTDCARLGLLHIAPDVEWVVSGINDGANLGVDIYMSGTVAAVREATLLGKRAVAFSHYRLGPQAIDWDAAAKMAIAVLRTLQQESLPAGTYWNVNFPAATPSTPAPATGHATHSGGWKDNDLPPLVFCEPDSRPLPIRFEQQGNEYHYRTDYHGRQAQARSDVEVCFSGKIAISRVALRRDF